MSTVIKTSVQQQWEQIDPATQHLNVIDKSLVDGELWYTVKCSDEAARSLREQWDDKWYQHIDNNWYTVKNTFDIDEETYIMLKLRWGK
jgi:hypothetical protein